ncbi:MAG: hypothetical protein EPN99_15675 [Frankiales bacterium]|nr:MAG: hypothetical protein EPN99_15675 [Frankiales bacterium]
MPLRRDTLLDAGLATLAAGVHLAMAATADRWPPEADFSLLFVVLPAALAAVAALVLLVNGDRRPLHVAAVYAWLMVLFTLPAQFLGVRWLPTAAVLTFALLHPAVSSDRSDAG